MKRRLMIALVIALPLSSVLFGATMFYLASTGPDHQITVTTTPLSKTNWQTNGE